MPKRKKSTAQENQEYDCDFNVKCHGGKAVSRRTFDRHSGYRIQSALLPDALHDSSEEASDSDNTDGSDSDNESNESLDGSPAKKTKVEHEYYWDDSIFRQSESQNDAQRTNNYNNSSQRSSPVDSDSEPEIDPGSIADDDLENQPLPSSDRDPSDDEGPDNDAPIPESSGKSSALCPKTLARLRDPSKEPIDISDTDLRFTVDLFLATNHGSEQIYNSVLKAYKRRHPENDILSLALIKKKVTEWSERETCRFCGTPRFDLITSATQEFYTMPLGLQLQALFHSPESAKDIDMHYCREKTQEILDSADTDGNLQIPVYED
ncbi:hypothetical protein B0H19DRAFT_1253974 [Mycena capillaripes]|nr:hypothetical protein B0H19DRAFT_1253974 [Mycena capillaripes]